MCIKRLEIFIRIELFVLSLLDVVSVKDSKVNHIRVDDVIQDGVTQHFEFFIAQVEVVSIFE